MSDKFRTRAANAESNAARFDPLDLDLTDTQGATSLIRNNSATEGACAEQTSSLIGMTSSWSFGATAPLSILPHSVRPSACGRTRRKGSQDGGKPAARARAEQVSPRVMVRKTSETDMRNGLSTKRSCKRFKQIQIKDWRR
jgi:hypothetical protein